MSEAGFGLRKWVTNDSKLQNFFDSQENSETKILYETDITFSEEQFRPRKSNYKKVLGLEWDIHLFFFFKKKKSNPVLTISPKIF